MQLFFHLTNHLRLILGPSVLDLFNSLLRHLKMSVEYTSNSDAEKTSNIKFQDSIINTIGNRFSHVIVIGADKCCAIQRLI